MLGKKLLGHTFSFMGYLVVEDGNRSLVGHSAHPWQGKDGICWPEGHIHHHPATLQR